MIKTFTDIISVEDYFVVVDKEAASKEGDYLTMKKKDGTYLLFQVVPSRNADELSMMEHSKQMWVKDVNTDYTQGLAIKEIAPVIATIGKRIEGIPLIEEVDEAEQLMNKEDFGNDHEWSEAAKYGFEKGYKVAQKKYSEEDIECFMLYLNSFLFVATDEEIGEPFNFDMIREVKEKYFASLQPKRIPVSVELEMEVYNIDGFGDFGYYVPIYVPKITSPETNTITPIKIIYE